jgi:hypothetical protein
MLVGAHGSLSNQDKVVTGGGCRGQTVKRAYVEVTVRKERADCGARDPDMSVPTDRR